MDINKNDLNVFGKPVGDYHTSCSLCNEKIKIKDSKEGLCPACHYDLQENEANIEEEDKTCKECGKVYYEETYADRYCQACLDKEREEGERNDPFLRDTNNADFWGLL